MVTWPEEWKIATIGEVFNVSAGGDVDKLPFSKVPTPIYKYEVFSNGVENRGLYGYSSKALYPANSLTVSARGTIGRTFYRDKDFNAIIRLLVLTPKSKNIDARFYSYYIDSQVVFVRENTGVAQLTVPRIKEIIIPIPPLEEQHAIADTLSAFDRHISALSALIAKHEAIRQGALEDLMTGRTRLEGFCGSWKTVNFEDVITPKARIGWQGLRKDEYLRSGYGYLISGTDFHDGTISLANIWQVSKARYDMDRNIQVTEGDVLVTKDGTIGKVAIVPKLSKPATLNSHVYVFRTKPSLNQKFLYYVLLSKTFRAFIDNLKSGSIIVSLPQKDLKLFRFMMPPLDEQLAISSVLSALDSNISSLKAEHSKLSAIRSAAINDLLSGKIRLTL